VIFGREVVKQSTARRGVIAPYNTYIPVYAHIYIYIGIFPSAPRPNIIRVYTLIRRVYNDNIILYSNNRRVIMCSDNL
jgi:hypothetical protein